MIQIVLLAGLTPAHAMRIFSCASTNPGRLNISAKARNSANNFRIIFASCSYRRSLVSSRCRGDRSLDSARDTERIEVPVAPTGPLFRIFRFSLAKPQKREPLIPEKFDRACLLIIASREGTIEEKRMSILIKSRASFGATFLAVTLVAQATMAQQTKDNIAIGYASPSGVFAPVFIAQEQGLFKKYGLGVKELILLRGTGPAAAQMLVAGTAPIAALGGALVEAAINGGGLVYIASTSNNLIFSLYSRSEIGRPEDLKGKTIAVDARGGSIELATIVAL